MSGARRALLVGGGGFLGTEVARRLRDANWAVRTASRRADCGADHVRVDLATGEGLAEAVKGCDAVVNLAGILVEVPGQSFQAVHAEGPARLAAAAKDAGIAQFVQVSAIGADPAAPSAYGRSKHAGEQAVLEALPGAVILRLSIIFGANDSFFNRFRDMASMSPFLPLIGGGATLFQPVYVGDVATAVVAVLDGKARPGAVYELGGPAVRSFRTLLEYLLQVTGQRRVLLSLPSTLARPLAALIEGANVAARWHLPPALVLTRDQIASLSVDNVVSDAAARDRRTLQGLGIVPRSVEEIVPSYLQ